MVQTLMRLKSIVSAVFNLERAWRGCNDFSRSVPNKSEIKWKVQTPFICQQV